MLYMYWDLEKDLSDKQRSFCEVENMFEVIDVNGYVYDAYGTFIDTDGDIQFILCDDDGVFYKTNRMGGYYKLHKKNI